MTGPWIVALVLALALVTGVVVATVALTRVRRRASALAARVARLEEELAAERSRPRPTRPAVPPAPAQQAEVVPVITHVGEPAVGRVPAGRTAAESAPARVTLSGPAFADTVLRETVVQAAALAHGVRRALSPDTLDRVRLEMRKEMRRSRKDRKAEMKEALREYRARHRRDMDPVT